MNLPVLLGEVQERILEGGAIERGEARQLAEATSRSDIVSLAAAGIRIRDRFREERPVELCALVSAKSGACPEDCSFCAQSSRARTDVPVYRLMGHDEIADRAKKLEETGADHVCLVMSGRGPSASELGTICAAATRIRRETSMMVCGSLGLLGDEEARRLRESGIGRYNHNLETAREYYPKICRSHTWDQRLTTAVAARKAGLELCCGGILGVGESVDDRLDLAFSLRDLAPELVPVNFLNPRPGTALEGETSIGGLEAVKYVALFRLIMPRAAIKVAGGREPGLRSLQSLALLAGADGIIVGGYLTTAGRGLAEDMQMLDDCGFGASPVRAARS